MMNFVLSAGRRYLAVLPAALVLGTSLFLTEGARGQLVPAEPLVLIADDADAFAAALHSELRVRSGTFSVDIVVIYPAPPTGVHLLLVDVAAKRKLWLAMTLRRLGSVLARIGEPA